MSDVNNNRLQVPAAYLHHAFGRPAAAAFAAADGPDEPDAKRLAIRVIRVIRSYPL
jgi:hypothetical protein